MAVRKFYWRKPPGRGRMQNLQVHLFSL